MSDIGCHYADPPSTAIGPRAQEYAEESGEMRSIRHVFPGAVTLSERVWARDVSERERWHC